MHTDLSPHLHTPKCNDLIQALKSCHEENLFMKFLGTCNTIDSQLVECLHNERKSRALNNRIQSAAKHKKIHELLLQSENK